ncbi:phosphoglycerate kinase [Paracoccus seriniphilus]|uniref:Phosphoglycerate kinase n=1 Tax=Paracoccus seriniphilus TaxID=184748 RepID=A0A239PR79_9RHOB|nr:phosphoglycerate kinase [Paracoccus seriniphilus]WCR12921.1 phosphoglycerate kinase [Paracoccus seriniphilus]SNT72648.1 phosphoglycerate kinase [Paracoccus seriniphilus]
MAKFNTIDDMNLDGKIVLTRVDLNVPVENGRVTDATRIEKIVPTVKDIQARGGIPVLLAHFDRPKGKRVESMSLKQIVPALEEALGQPVKFGDDCIGGPAKRLVASLEAGDVALLENTRFHEGEEKNDSTFAASLAALGGAYVNDAFSAAHRAHASTEGLARLLPAGAGRLMEAELKALDAALGNPQRPVMAVVGGAKVSTKLDLLMNLLDRVDHLVIGGGMANTFLVARGIEVGKSLAERDMADTARAIMEKAEKGGCTIHLPVDIVVAREFKAGADNEVLPVDQCPADAMILDAGPDTVAALRGAMEHCRTLIWNGPMGAFEIEPFDRATNAAAQAAAELTRKDELVSVAGGGDTVAALNKAGVAGDFTFISTAGGAFLEWMEGKDLPGVAVLEAAVD